MISQPSLTSNLIKRNRPHSSASSTQEFDLPTIEPVIENISGYFPINTDRPDSNPPNLKLVKNNSAKNKAAKEHQQKTLRLEPALNMRLIEAAKNKGQSQQTLMVQALKTHLDEIDQS